MEFRAQYRLASFLLVAVLPVAMAACSPGRPQTLREGFGDAAAWHRQAQVLDPEASANLTPQRSMDGGGAAAAHEQYVKSFTPKQRQTTIAYTGLGGIAGE